ncbi:MAG: DUF2630 family protein [Acidimicrobiales bacterium]
MDDASIVSRISELVEDEHRLSEHVVSGGATAEDRERHAALEVELDRCWDLLRQRRARREAHQDVDDATVRSADVVEHYEQ